MDFLKGFARRAGWLIASALVLAYGWMALRGPQGLQALLEKRREIRELDRQEPVEGKRVLGENAHGLGDKPPRHFLPPSVRAR